MSYTIEYKRQFIESQEGITPCWLAGDNNLYENLCDRVRRAREWCCFHNLVGVTKANILDSVQESLGGYEQHWKRNNKWVDDKGLIRWVETGCKSAAAIEDILDANPHLFGDIRCYVVIWENHLSRIELDYFVSSTEEFDRWIRMYRALCDNLTAKGCSVYPVIYLGSEDRFRSYRSKKNPSERYILKRQKLLPKRWSPATRNTEILW